MFLLISRYLKPIDEVDRFLAEHRAFLDRYYDSGLLVVSGSQEPRTGGVIVTADAPREAIDRALADDPFVREGISEYEIIEFNPSKRAQGFLAALAANSS
ncbi:MAG: YciI family protein [Vulcanimicrobiaceae bacterium]